MKKVLAALVGLVVLVAGCTAASHLKLLQPPASPTAAQPQMTIFGHRVALRGFERGINIDWYTSPGQDVAAGTAAVVGFVKSLHANAVMVTFPFFMDGIRGRVVHARAATPSPAEIGAFASAAEGAGLAVSLRPLLGNGSIGKSREHLVPADPRAWFASYRKFLLRYARVAQLAGVSRLYVGTELSGFELSPLWSNLDKALRRVYHGQLACAANSGALRPWQHGCGSAIQAVDAYPSFKFLRSDARTARVRRAWQAWDHAWLRRGEVISEIGIAAVPGAYRHPSRYHWPGPAVPVIQARWFTAACQAAVRERLGGIYFWAIPFGTAFTGPTAAKQMRWARSAGARAIAACYKAQEGAR